MILVKNILFLQKIHRQINLEIFAILVENKKSKYIIMNNETWQCILCEKMCIIPYENYKYITNFNKNKDIYLENIDAREVTFLNFCDQCYGDDSAISCYIVSNYS